MLLRLLLLFVALCVVRSDFSVELSAIDCGTGGSGTGRFALRTREARIHATMSAGSGNDGIFSTPCVVASVCATALKVLAGRESVKLFSVELLTKGRRIELGLKLALLLRSTPQARLEAPKTDLEDIGDPSFLAPSPIETNSALPLIFRLFGIGSFSCCGPTTAGFLQPSLIISELTHFGCRLITTETKSSSKLPISSCSSNK
mmetsp:Transcript_24603/g.48435  ORF Transcript_24603/g.48435 Transcript_24603/m.48435 type:complete len:203 (-) Transcript_24603:1735-2343(-)